jgi:hypothetical protein
MHECWASCIDIGLGIYLLKRQLGLASAAPGVLFLLFNIVGLQTAASMGQQQRLWHEGQVRKAGALLEAVVKAQETPAAEHPDRLALQSLTCGVLNNILLLCTQHKFSHDKILICSSRQRKRAIYK